ncbi:hypothetical protein [Algoriphagus litoralis]|uniref:hypothetical protein n=1 Tax=Algoriphagus litoralis TaxID=2202829 RepID=UPI000DB9A4DE|nr:hypothetical protein [Algoriphagus litoralis]
MSQVTPVRLSISIESPDGSPIKITSLKINDEEFVPKKTEKENIPDPVPISENIETKVVAATVIAALPSDEAEEVLVEVSNDRIVAPESRKLNTESNTLEEFGGDSFYRMFWGKLTYKALNDKTSLVTYQGSENVFDHEFVGKWLEPSRVHKCSSEYPSKGRNYFPSANGVVYSKVLEVRDGKNLVVDFSYNGGSIQSPKAVSDQDGTFFFDNKFAIERWAGAAHRKDNLIAKSGQIYASLGFPKIVVTPDSTLNFQFDGLGDRPAIHLMVSDAFTGDINGTGDQMPDSFKETFGENLKLFELPGQGRVDLNFDWQLIPPTYAQKVVQYGVPNGVIFFDGAASSSQYGLKRFANFNQFLIKEKMTVALGFTRPGVTCSMPNQGYCNGGGIHDGSDIKEFCTYRFEGDWFARDPNNMKARTSGGLRLEWIGKSTEKPGRFVELESQKAFQFEDLKLKFSSNSEVEVDSPDFTWFHLACQEWTGGTSTGSEFTHLIVDGRKIGLNSNGDFWLVNGEGDLKGRSFSARSVKLFDRIPSKGDLIKQDLQNLREGGIIGKVADNRFEIWGWSIQEGDQLSAAGEVFTVKSIGRKWKTWEQFAVQNNLSEPRLKRGDRRITYTEIELDKPVTGPVSSIQFRVERSVLEHLLDGQFRNGCKAAWGIGNESPGHLMYIDYNVNLVLRNVDIHGMIRSTARPLWAETSKSHSGLVNAISVNNLGAPIWKKGHKLLLAHPESGKIQQVELIQDFDGNRGEVKIASVNLPVEFPQNSILVGLYSLPSEARFEHVSYINEDLSPCYSERIDYRPQGLRLRQLLTKDNSKRVQIIGGRISWYSNMENRFEPEIEFSEKPHLVNTKSVVPVILNPIIKDKQGVHFGFQRKESGKEELFLTNRLVVTDGKTVDISNSVLGADLYLEGNGEFILHQVNSNNYVDNKRDTGYGFSIVVQDKFKKTESLQLTGKGGKAGMMINSPYGIGVLRIDFQDWELKPALFNGGGFQSQQNQNDPRYREFVRISK